MQGYEVWKYCIIIYQSFCLQLYGVCCGSYTKEFNLPRQISAVGHLISSARTSLSSLVERRNSNVSLLERRPSFQSRKRSSDSSIVSDKESTVRSSSSNNTYLTKREVMFSPIHEHDEGVSEINEVYSNYNTQDANSTFVQLI